MANPETHSPIELMAPKLPSNTRKFFDPDKLREWVKADAKEAFQKKLNKLETPDYKLHVKDVDFHDGDKRFSFKEQKDAILERRDLALPLRGTFQLEHKPTGKIIAEKKTIIAQVPYITERNTAILNGSEYIIINQQRLKPGVYTRIKETGEAEAHVNVKPGTGLGGKIIFHPEKALFIYVVGTTQIKLYGLLHDLGVSDESMKEAWGNEIFLKNKMQYGGDEVDKFYNKVFKYK